MKDSIPISLKDWATLASDKHPDYSLISYGTIPGSNLVRRIVTRRKKDSLVFVAETSAVFHDNTDWQGDIPFTRLYVGVPHTVWETR